MSAATIASLARRFSRDRSGNVAMIFGLSILPLMGAIGLSIDFGNVMAARTKAQMAADAAALQASGVARDIIKSGDGSAASTAAAITEAKTRATALFNAHVDQAGVPGATVDLTVVRTGQNISANANFSVKTTNYVGKLFGQNTFTAAGSAQSASSLPSFSDVYLALDISQSMGIAATQDDMNKLYNAKINKLVGLPAQTSCVFGCHAVEAGNAESMASVAKRNGVTLRIDVLREATKKMINTASEDADSAPIYRLGLYEMGMSVDYKSARLIELKSLSNDFTALNVAADTIDLGPVPENKYSDSYINENLVSLNNMVTTAGDGSAQSKAKKYAFVITDGVRDLQTPSSAACTTTGNRCVSAVSTASCDDLKRKGVTVGVLYTTYSKINPIAAGSDWYQIQVVNTGVAANIASQLKSCASPGWYFEASDGAAIDVAMQKMFSQTTDAPSLTN